MSGEEKREPIQVTEEMARTDVLKATLAVEKLWKEKQGLAGENERRLEDITEGNERMKNVIEGYKRLQSIVREVTKRLATIN